MASEDTTDVWPDTPGPKLDPVAHLKHLVVRADSYLDDNYITLGWRSWIVILITCFRFIFDFSIYPCLPLSTYEMS
jgi:hypothetical protein